MHHAGGSNVKLPRELVPYRPLVENYVEQRIKEFALSFAYGINPNIPQDHALRLTHDTLAMLQAPPLPVMMAANLRLVLKHDCESSGCGDNDCILCQYNPTRLCKRNLKQKYLIDDNLRAKCGANVRVELNDEAGKLVANDLLLEINVLSWDKYKEVCTQGSVMTIQHLRACFVQNAQKALLKREGGREPDDTRVLLQLERGIAQLSEMQATTSSEALLSGKAPGFMLLIAAVDSTGEPMPSIQYVVSEKFVVTTKRVKQAIKSDIPTVDQHVSKLVHIGRATVDKLLDLRTASQEDGIDIELPEDLGAINTVGQFQSLVEKADLSSDFKGKLLKLLKLSPEKWEEVAQHAQQAVVPDFRPRMWCHPGTNVGLLFNARHAAVQLEAPVALIQISGDSAEDYAVPIHQLDPGTRNHVQELRRQGKQAWYMPGHPGWAVYWKESEHISSLCQVSAAESTEHATEESAASKLLTAPPTATSPAGLAPSPPIVPPSTKPQHPKPQASNSVPQQPEGKRRHIGAAAPGPTTSPEQHPNFDHPPRHQPPPSSMGGPSNTPGGNISMFPPESSLLPHSDLLPLPLPPHLHARTSQPGPSDRMESGGPSPFASSGLHNEVFNALGNNYIPHAHQEALALKLASVKGQGGGPSQWGSGGSGLPPHIRSPSLEMITSEDLAKLAGEGGVAQSLQWGGPSDPHASSDKWFSELLQGGNSSMIHQYGASLQGGSVPPFGYSSLDVEENMRGNPGSLPPSGSEPQDLSLKLSMSLDLGEDGQPLDNMDNVDEKS